MTCLVVVITLAYLIGGEAAGEGGGGVVCVREGVCVMVVMVAGDGGG